MTINVVHLLIGLLVWGLVFYVVRWAMAKLAIPDPIPTVVIVVLAILCLLWLLNSLGLVGPVIRIGWVLPAIGVG